MTDSHHSPADHDRQSRDNNPDGSTAGLLQEPRWTK